MARHLTISVRRAGCLDVFRDALLVLVILHRGACNALRVVLIVTCATYHALKLEGLMPKSIVLTRGNVGKERFGWFARLLVSEHLSSLHKTAAQVPKLEQGLCRRQSEIGRRFRARRCHVAFGWFSSNDTVTIRQLVRIAKYGV